jgi:hypothetical protein
MFKSKTNSFPFILIKPFYYSTLFPCTTIDL